MPIKNTETTPMKEFIFHTRCQKCGRKVTVSFQDGSFNEAVRNLKTRAALFPDKFHHPNCPSKSLEDLEF
jgi:hypothetical protein